MPDYWAFSAGLVPFRPVKVTAPNEDAAVDKAAPSFPAGTLILVDAQYVSEYDVEVTVTGPPPTEIRKTKKPKT